MTTSQTRYEHILAKLRQSDYRMTPQRLALIRFIAESEEHPNAAQVYEQIRTQYPTMSLATVYTTLELLKNLGEVNELSYRDDSHYDGIRPYPHPHLICTRCKKILDGKPFAQIDAVAKEMEKVSGFRIDHHQLDFYGLCPDCQALSANP